MMNTLTGIAGIVRLVAVVAVLLLAPFSSAMANGASAHNDSHQSLAGAGNAGVSQDWLASSAPLEPQPLHCHLRTPGAQEDGPVQSTPENNPPPLIARLISAPKPSADLQMPTVLAGMHGHAPPRFILFGNFRS